MWLVMMADLEWRDNFEGSDVDEKKTLILTYSVMDNI